MKNLKKNTEELNKLIKINMEKEALIQKLVDAKAEINNTIDLNAYAHGLEDMYIALAIHHVKIEKPTAIEVYNQAKECKNSLWFVKWFKKRFGNNTNQNEVGSDTNHLKLLPVLEENMILEYRDLMGNWYEYTKELQENKYFKPIRGIRVRNKSKNE